MRIGFIGLGNMRNPMAANLIRAGYELTVHDLKPKNARNLLQMEAQWAASPRAVAGSVDTVIASLPGPREVEAVLLGDDGVLAGLSAGGTWIDMSTSSPDLAHRIAHTAGVKDIAVLDAPVTGAIDGAQAGTLNIFVGGEREVFDRHLPVFEALGERVFLAGPLGSGLAAKLITNMLWFINAVAVGDALMLGAKSGLDLPTLWQIIQSSADNSWMAEHDVPAIFRGDYDPSFTLALCSKDLDLISTLGRQLGVPLELSALVEQRFLQAREKYGATQGEMSVMRLLEDTLGVELRAAGY